MFPAIHQKALRDFVNRAASDFGARSLVNEQRLPTDLLGTTKGSSVGGNRPSLTRARWRRLSPQLRAFSTFSYRGIFPFLQP